MTIRTDTSLSIR